MITFSAGEIFKMAQDIEADGARFYRKAAEHAAGQDCRGVLLRLADMEEELFNMRTQMATGHLKDTASVKMTRRDVARVMTVLQQRAAQQAQAE